MPRGAVPDHRASSRGGFRFRRRLAFVVASLTLVSVAGCTTDQAAPFGKAMLGLMIVFLIATPMVFYRAWRRRTRP